MIWYDMNYDICMIVYIYIYTYEMMECDNIVVVLLLWDNHHIIRW